MRRIVRTAVGRAHWRPKGVEMSKPSRIEQIYHDFKQVLFETPMRPGERVDIEALARHYGVSTMPIRLLLNRAVGEGVLEVSRHQGYIVPGATEQRIRDIHTWNKQVLLLALETAMDDESPALPDLALTTTDIVGATEKLFLAIADLSHTTEAHKAIASMNDRLRSVRQLDIGTLIDLPREIADLDRAWRERDLFTLHRLVWQYHQRRFPLVSKFVALAYSQ